MTERYATMTITQPFGVTVVTVEEDMAQEVLDSFSWNTTPDEWLVMTSLKGTEFVFQTETIESIKVAYAKVAEPRLPIVEFR